MLRGGSGRFPSPEKREPPPKGKCPVCGITISLSRDDNGIFVISIHAPFNLRCEGSGSRYPIFGC